MLKVKTTHQIELSVLVEQQCQKIVENILCKCVSIVE